MVIVPEAAVPENMALSPDGNPDEVPIPIVPDVECVIFGEIGTPMQELVVFPEETLFKGVIITVAVEFEQLPPPGTVYV